MFHVTPSVDEVDLGSTIDVLYMYISVHPYLEVCTKKDVVGKVVISSDSFGLLGVHSKLRTLNTRVFSRNVCVTCFSMLTY